MTKMDSTFETQAPGAEAITNTQAYQTDQAGAARDGSVSPMSTTSDHSERVDSDAARFDEFIKMPDEGEATGYAQQGTADKENSEEGDTSFGCSNEDSVPSIASTFGGSDGTGRSEVVDRDTAIAEILEMLGMWPEITLALIDFTGKRERLLTCFAVC